MCVHDKTNWQWGLSLYIQYYPRPCIHEKGSTCIRIRYPVHACSYFNCQKIMFIVIHDHVCYMRKDQLVSESDACSYFLPKNKNGEPCWRQTLETKTWNFSIKLHYFKSISKLTNEVPVQLFILQMSPAFVNNT